jgi:hypothetical protein
MKKIRQRNEDFANHFNRLTLNDIMLFTDKSVSIKEILEIKKLFKRRTPEYGDFLQRMLEFPPITPKRYVWHVGGAPYYRGCSDLQCFSIAIEGIKSRNGQYDHQVVFANNNSYHCSRFFPFIDDFNSDPKDPCVDYWRIDTHAFEAEWYVDPNMQDLMPFFYDDPTDYICTPADIPAHALQLYHYPEALFKHHDPQSLLDYSIYDTRVLVPDDRVNWWINRKLQAA